EDLSDEWREAMQTKFLPGVATTERPRKFAQPLLSERRSGGQVFVAPVLSSDGKYVAFLSNGSFLRGEVFIDLWLGDARTGKRIKRLVKSTLNTDAEELGIIYSQSAFSPDAKTLAYSALRKGKEVLYLLNVKKRDVVRRFDLPGVENVSGPSFSPDGKQIVFSGGVGGITDLYVVNVDGTGLRRLTNDRNADLQPQWSPDGRTIAFASDRGPQTDFSVLRYSPWQIALIDVASGRVEVPAGQAGLNLNPVWAPDGRSIAYVSDRTGTQNIFLYDLDRRDHFQLTNVVGGVLSFTEQSPVISWAHQADRLAFTYYENGDMTVWTIDNPRLLRRDPYREPTAPNGAKVIAAAAQAAARDSARLRDSSVALALAADTTGLALRQRSFYRSPNETVRASAELPAADIRAADTAVVSVARLLDSAALALPDTSKFKDYAYHVGYQPEYVARPSVGYVGGTNFGRGVFGGTTIVLSDLLGNNRLAFSGQVNGRVSEAQLFAGYTNLSHHLQYTTGVMQAPYYVLYGQGYGAGRAAGLLTEETDIVRYLVRDVFLVGMYPFSRFTRFELGTEFSNVDRAVQRIGRDVIETTGQPYSDYYYIEQKNLSSFNYAAPFAGWVSDNALFGYTGPIMGRRYHFQVQPTIGSFRWIDYLADYRRYDPILFNFLTVATRVGADISVGRDEMALPKYLGSPQSNFWLRGYDRQNFFSTIGCNQGTFGVNAACGAPQMIGSRVVLASAELRFPLIRRFDLGLLPVSLPPLDGLIFYDAGMAWQGGQTAHFLRPPNDYDPALDRYLLTSYGAGLRLNLFNFALLRWDYAIPIDQPNHKGFWQFSLGPSF
ncbi:MAG TPA: hypothetical protein VFJ74_09675, partial [Gemmatimonadaceae bacterium]|nr:hypothetical protein [Gemmatimonadaceae bacterium]